MLDHALIAKAAAGMEPLPPTVGRLAAIIIREDGGLGEIEEIVRLDPVLTGRILNVANAVPATRGAAIGTVRGAITKLGAGRVLALALSGPLSRRLQRPVPGYGLSEGALWRHLVASALAVELLAGMSRVSVPPEAFAAALLHDLGQIVLAQFLDPELRRLLSLAREQGASSREAEIEILGVHHGEVGALVAQKWRLPERIVQAIAFAGSSAAGEDVLFDVVHVGHVAAGRIGEYPGMPARDLQLDSDLLERVGLGRAAAELLQMHLKERLGDVLRLYA